MYRNLPSHKQYLIAEVLESNDPQNITEEPDTIRDDIIDKTLGEYTAAMATVKLWSKLNVGAYILCVTTKIVRVNQGQLTTSNSYLYLSRASHKS